MIVGPISDSSPRCAVAPRIDFAASPDDAPATLAELLAGLLWALPLSSAAAFAVLLGWRTWRERGRLNVVEAGPRQRIELLSRHPLEAGAAAAFPASMIAAVTFATRSGPGASPWPPAIGLAAVGAISLFWWNRIRRRRRAGRYDLVVDAERQVLALPVTEPRTQRVAVPLRSVQAVKVRAEADDDRSEWFKVVVRLSPAEAARQEVDAIQPIFTSAERPAADRLAQWLRAACRAARSDETDERRGSTDTRSRLGGRQRG